MDFDSVIGHEEIKRRLISEADNGKVAHAIMLCGPEGNGAMAIALAYARYLLCKSDEKHDGSVCGKCSSCAMTDKLQHPDLHFAFPIYKLYSAPKPTYCDDFLKEWRGMLLQSPHFGYEEWAVECDVVRFLQDHLRCKLKHRVYPCRCGCSNRPPPR